MSWCKSQLITKGTDSEERTAGTQIGIRVRWSIPRREYGKYIFSWSLSPIVLKLQIQAYKEIFTQVCIANSQRTLLTVYILNYQYILSSTSRFHLLEITRILWARIWFSQALSPNQEGVGKPECFRSPTSIQSISVTPKVAYQYSRDSRTSAHLCEPYLWNVYFDMRTDGCTELSIGGRDHWSLIRWIGSNKRSARSLELDFNPEQRYRRFGPSILSHVCEDAPRVRLFVL